MPIGMRDMEQEYAITLDSVSKVFGPRPLEAVELAKQDWSKERLLNEKGSVLALNDVSLKIRRGDIHVIMGLSGSGKSTLIRCINRLVTPTCGSILVGDENIVGMPEKRLRQIRNEQLSMVFQSYGLWSHLSVWENVAFGLCLRKVPKAERKEKAMEVLELVALDQWVDKYPNELSGGMQQRVGLARALALDTPILLMDEPFSGLDPLIRHELQGELLRLQEKLNKTIVFITHSMDESLRMGDHITILRDGRVVDHGTPSYMVLESSDKNVRKFAANANPLRILTAKDALDEGASVCAVVDGGLEVLSTASCGQSDVGYIIFIERDNSRFIGISEQRMDIESVKSARFADIALQQECIKMGKDELIADYLRFIADNSHHVAVVDEDDIYVGSFGARSVLSLLAEKGYRT